MAMKPMRKFTKATENTANDLVGEIVCGFLFAIIAVNMLFFDLWHDWTGVKADKFYGSLIILAIPFAFGFVMFRVRVGKKLSP